MKHALILALLLVAGCKMEQPKQADTLAKPAAEHSANSAAKVAAVMAANDITLPQVASWLDTYGFDVINRAEFKRWHWSPPTTGAPVAYYVVNFRVAIGDTTLPVYIPQTAGPYWIRVKALSGAGVSGPWSFTNQSVAGPLLPGVAD